MINEELTVKQASSYLDVYDGEIRRYIREGRLPARREGKQQYRIRKSDLDAFRDGTLTEEAFSRDSQPVDDALLEASVPIKIKQLMEWGLLPGPGSGVPQVRPFPLHQTARTLSR